MSSQRGSTSTEEPFEAEVALERWLEGEERRGIELFWFKSGLIEL